jgi:CBS domain-containing protein
MRATVRDLMTPDPVTVDESTPLQQVALVMKEQDIGDVIVERQGTPAGIVTDRDIVVRALAENEDARTLQAGDICSGDVVSVGPDDGIDDAAGLMRDAAVRRVPVVDDGRVVGIVSLGDLARREDPGSVLSDISDDPPND